MASFPETLFLLLLLLLALLAVRGGTTEEEGEEEEERGPTSPPPPPNSPASSTEADGAYLCRSRGKMLPPGAYRLETCALCYYYMPSNQVSQSLSSYPNSSC